MKRPYIICHMTASLDGKVTGNFLFRQECAPATEIYYEINRKLKCDGFICGRVTMEESFTAKWYPDLENFESVNQREDFIPENLSGFYAVAFDTKGRLGWKTNRIADPDGDEGYDNAQIIEVLSEEVNSSYLGYLRHHNIPYIFAGKDTIDVNIALEKLSRLFGITKLLLEGGSIINGAFQRADAVDEINLVIAPTVADSNSKPLFTDSSISDFTLNSCTTKNNVLILNYKKN